MANGHPLPGYFFLLFSTIKLFLLIRIKKIYFSRLIKNVFPSFQVWFQNRRMKDKRQRLALAWPYAAVYTDPTFAASLLQAAASTLPLHYPPPPPVYPHHYPRYHPYPGFGLPQAGALPVPNPALSVGQNMPTGVPQAMPQGLPNALQHGFNLGLGLDFPSYQQNFNARPNLTPRSSPVHSEMSLSPPMNDGLLMTANVSPGHTQVSQEKPKLFKPYKSEPS